MMKNFLDKIPLLALAIAAVFLAFAPFGQEPHLVEKVKMLFAGSLSRPIDIFDLVMHSTPLVLLVFKLYFMLSDRGSISSNQDD